MKSYMFRVEVEPDQFEDGTPAFHGYCPALSGCHTWGHTREETLTRIQEAISLYIEDLVAAGGSVPVNAEQGATELSAPAVVVNV